MWISRIVLLLVGASAMISALPTQCLDEDHHCQLTEAVMTVVNADQELRKQLADTLVAVKESQTGIKEFLVSAASRSDEGLAAAVAEALSNAGVTSGGPSFRNLTETLQSLNQLFSSYLTKLACSSPFHVIGDECFFFILEDKTWEDARQKCFELGADLATPSDVNRLRLHIGSRYPRKSRRNFWLGGHSENKVWSWLTGAPIQEGLWYTNEPSGNGECLAMFDGWEHPFTDFPCDNERRAVCEKPLQK